MVFNLYELNVMKEILNVYFKVCMCKTTALWKHNSFYYLRCTYLLYLNYYSYLITISFMMELDSAMNLKGRIKRGNQINK